MDFEDFFKSLFPKNNPDQIRKEINFEINGVKTQVVCYFDKNGFLMATVSNCLSVNKEERTVEKIDEEIKQAIAEEDYERAAALKKEKKDLKP